MGPVRLSDCAGGVRRVGGIRRPVPQRAVIASGGKEGVAGDIDDGQRPVGDTKLRLAGTGQLRGREAEDVDLSVLTFEPQSLVVGRGVRNHNGRGGCRLCPRRRRIVGPAHINRDGRCGLGTNGARSLQGTGDAAGDGNTAVRGMATGRGDVAVEGGVDSVGHAGQIEAGLPVCSAHVAANTEATAGLHTGKSCRTTHQHVVVGGVTKAALTATGRRDVWASVGRCDDGVLDGQ